MTRIRAKAAVLRHLQQAHCTAFRIEPFIELSIGDWHQSPPSIWQTIDAANLGPTLVVRSAWREEDCQEKSHPGQFLSVQGVPAQNWTAVSSAIDRVIESYRQAGELSEQDDRVIVQRQLCDVMLAGVATPSASGLYLDVDFDDSTGRTDTVTAGLACRTVSIWMQAPLQGHWAKLVAAHREVEQLMTEGRWSVEFAVDLHGAISVFQARYSGQARRQQMKPSAAEAAMNAARDAVPRQTVLSDMADWNPAEILGSKPGPLALSLYHALVTERAWVRARQSLGYRSHRHTSLTVEIAGKLYVDVASSCLSLLPKGLPRGLAKNLCADRIARLREQTSLHDRVETKLFFTCGDVMEVPRTRELLARGFSQAAVEALELQLGKLTHVAVRSEPMLGESDAEAVRALWAWYDRNRPRSGDVGTRLRFVSKALVRCRDFGVIPFARQARLAFIGQDLLSRLEESGAVSPEWTQGWWRGLDSVASRVSRAIEDLGDGTLSREVFDEEYGHLRPRAYDIRCLPYSRQQFYSSLARRPTPARVATNELRGVDRNLVRRGLARSGADMSPEDFLGFVRRTTQAREALKFGFTKVLSAILEEIADLGAKFSLSREDLAYLRVEDLTTVQMTANPRELARTLSKSIEHRRIEWDALNHLELPDLLQEPEDLYVVEDVRACPNYITNENVVAECLVYDPREAPRPEHLRGRILVAEAAEPGMDWIFAYGIVGIITQYGGRNSHMATRCAEFGLPAAIGCGAAALEQIRTGTVVRLDCAREQVELLEGST